jgi:hypothetical protein
MLNGVGACVLVMTALVMADYRAVLTRPPASDCAR